MPPSQRKVKAPELFDAHPEGSSSMMSGRVRKHRDKVKGKVRKTSERGKQRTLADLEKEKKAEVTEKEKDLDKTDQTKKSIKPAKVKMFQGGKQKKTKTKK